MILILFTIIRYKINSIVPNFVLNAFLIVFNIFSIMFTIFTGILLNSFKNSSNYISWNSISIIHWIVSLVFIIWLNLIAIIYYLFKTDISIKNQNVAKH